MQNRQSHWTTPLDARQGRRWSLAQVEQQLPPHVDKDEHAFQELKVAIHQQLVESLDLSQIGRMDPADLEAQIDALAAEACAERSEFYAENQRERLHEELMSELFGLGPLENLMRDPDVSDILVNDAHTVYIERHGCLEQTDITFADDAHLVRIIQRIVARLGRRIDEVSPMVDARLPDGSRVNAAIPPLALDGPTLSIRRFGAKPLRMLDLQTNCSLLPEMGQFLAAAVTARIGCAISGGTGAGKTTLLNAISSFIPDSERIVTIEDSAELILQNPHRVRLETRPPNAEGAGELTQRDLVRNSLRMRPDRIIVGEVRGAEAWDMLQAMNTGHDGSLTTIHANSSPDALARLEMMVAMTGFDLPIDVVRQYIAAGITLIVHLARLKGGLRRVVQISEIVGIERGNYQVEDIFVYRQTGVDENGVATGAFHATGYRPTFIDRIEAAGIDLSDDLFRERTLESQP